jgi:two-component system response regulator NreC
VTPIRVLSIDPHELFRQGLRALFSQTDDIELAGEASDAVLGEVRAAELSPDLVLMEIAMPGPCSFETARRIRKFQPNTQVAFLTAYDDEEYLVESMRIGAAGYVLKNSPVPTLFTAVRDMHRGGKFLSSRMLAYVVDEMRQRRGGVPQPRTHSLTSREREVVKLIAEGNSVKEVATQLNVSAKTVEAHKCNLMRKLDLHNKAQLVQYAYQTKILRLVPLAINPQLEMLA